MPDEGDGSEGEIKRDRWMTLGKGPEDVEALLWAAVACACEAQMSEQEDGVVCLREQGEKTRTYISAWSLRAGNPRGMSAMTEVDARDSVAKDGRQSVRCDAQVVSVSRGWRVRASRGVGGL